MVLFVPIGSQEPSTAKAKAKPLLMRVKPQAKRMRANRGSPLMKLFSSGRILQEPTFKVLARPRIDVKTDVMKATENRMESLQSNLLKMSS